MFLNMNMFNHGKSFENFNHGNFQPDPEIPYYNYNESFPKFHVSDHAFQRFKERTLIAPDEVYEFTRCALEWGRDLNSYSAERRQYLMQKTAHGCWPITYGGLLLLFSQDYSVLVTVYPLPAWFFSDLPRCNASFFQEMKLSFRNRLQSLRTRFFHKKNF